MEINDNEETIYTEKDLEDLDGYWMRRMFVAIVVVTIIASLISGFITYYVAVGKTNDKFYDSTKNSKSVDEEGKEKKEIVKASETVSGLTEVLSIFAEFIDEHYIGEIDKNELIDSTIKGFVAGIGDEYSEYMTADEWETYQADALGNYVGVGIYMKIDNDYVLIESTIRGTPAEKAELKSGDYIIAVNGESTYGITASEASSKIKGEEGTEVTLTILRDTETFDVTLKREAIKVYHATSKILEDDIGYIELYTFDEGCSTDFKNNMDELISKGATKVIIDLRFNTGGLVSEALSILDLFLDKDQVELITKSARGSESVQKSKTEKVYDVDVVVLVNEYSASASEIVTGALKDNNIAKVVGKTTYGKGVIQNVYELTDKSVLKLTTQEYYTPNNSKIHKVGIKPDYEVDLPEDENDTTDTQLEKAKEVLKENNK